MAHVVLSIGANLGDRLAALQSVIDGMPGGFRNVRASHAYETPPWGVLEQPAFLNAVVVADTDLTPMQVLSFARRCEESSDRVRDTRWGPRTLDVDIITYDDLVSHDPELTLPHPRAHERAFVLVPWVEVEPTAVIPGLGAAADFLEVLGSAGISQQDALVVPA